MDRRRSIQQDCPSLFLQKTYEMLSDESLEDVLSWTEDGTGFVIKSPAEFSERILPKYFKHSNLASFIRQLNMYDFHKKRSTGKEQTFKHPLFLKGQPDFLKCIHRKTPEVNWPVQCKSSEPDLRSLFSNICYLHKKSSSSDSQIRTLEDKVAELSDQNIALSKINCDTKTRLKRLEDAMVVMASLFERGKLLKHYPGSISLPGSNYMITEQAVPYKKAKDQDYDSELDEILSKPSTIESPQFRPVQEYLPSIEYEDNSAEDNIDILLNS